MSDDNVLKFPGKLRDAIDDEQWRELQGEFYLDCYQAQHGEPSDDPDQLRQWLLKAELYAEIDNPFFRGWLVRRLSERD
ncbi:MAG: hypothetical protein QNJ78_05110 [Gammaproteobacteria bacterium]|nr:hypothetical protein [Gammaproteobacteria bacterium]